MAKCVKCGKRARLMSDLCDECVDISAGDLQKAKDSSGQTSESPRSDLAQLMLTRNQILGGAAVAGLASGLVANTTGIQLSYVEGSVFLLCFLPLRRHRILSFVTLAVCASASYELIK